MTSHKITRKLTCEPRWQIPLGVLRAADPLNILTTEVLISVTTTTAFQRLC